VNYDNLLVVNIKVTCYLWAPSSGDHLFTCGAIFRPPHLVSVKRLVWRSIFASLEVMSRSWSRRLTGLESLNIAKKWFS